MEIPANFKYKDILFLGRPIHDKNSAFYAEHPPMPASRWAKIYAPFDALRGFNECIAEQEVVRTERRTLDEDTQREMNRKLEILKNLTWNSRMAKENHIQATVEYYDTYLHLYETVSGMVWKVDTDISNTMKIDNRTIDLDGIIDIEAANLFDRDWQLESI